jgi:class 3 adenylate cyclase
MENKGLLFIPDISGFTRFVNEIELEHCQHIIQQLLEVLINANQTGLEVSEIEGDAILFYKFGEPLELEALYRQVERMFCEFHRHLNAYDQRRICQCRACVAAVDLTLKVITPHSG